MKVTSLDNPVKVDWLFDQGCRLDPAPYLSGALEARKRLEALPNTVRLDTVTESIHHAGRFSRRWVQSPEHGIPFFSSTDILEADYSYLPYIAKSAAKENPRLLIRPRWTLVTRSGTVGRVAYARPDIDGFACSEHVMRIRPNEKNIPAGYLNTFLRSRFGIPMIVSSAYGAIIQHIEPHHLADLPVPRFGADLEQRIHDLVEEAAHLRAAFQAGLNTATEDFFRSVGLSDLIDYRWHAQEPDTGFVVNGVSPVTLRAINYRPRAQQLLAHLQSVPGMALGEVCEGGVLRTGARFKRIDAAPEHGVRLVGQRQAFWTRPEGRWISPAAAPADILQTDETILVAAHGTFGENEVYSRSVFVTGSALANAYSQDFLRVASGTEEVPGAYLFALLRSNVMFRIFRSISVGGKQQEYHPQLFRSLPIPLAPVADRTRIAETVRRAFRHRDRADVLEDEALDLLTKAIEGAEV